MNRKQLLALALAVLPLLAACEQAPQDADGMTADTTTTDTAMGFALVVDADAELAPIDRSGITGTVRGDADGDGASIDLEVEGLEPGSVYPAHIHSGRCAAGGPVVVALGRIDAEDDGSAELSARVEESELPADEPLFVQVHDPDGNAVACADLADGGTGGGLTDRAEDADAALDDPEAADPTADADTGAATP